MNKETMIAWLLMMGFVQDEDIDGHKLEDWDYYSDTGELLVYVHLEDHTWKLFVAKTVTDPETGHMKYDYDRWAEGNVKDCTEAVQVAQAAIEVKPWTQP